MWMRKMRTENVQENNSLYEALVELTGPDGKVYQFRYGATIPHEGQDYVVLIELEPDASGEEQILITRLEKHEEGQLAFVVESNEEVVGQVFEKFMTLAVHSCDCGCENDGCDCGCEHEHHHHEDACGCGCEHEHHHEHTCGCGCEHDD